jgi:hypothetical protein
VKQQRIIFFKKQKGEVIYGIGQNADWIAEGLEIPPDRGGGKIASMTLRDGMIYIRKVNPDGTPCRNFGSVNVKGNVRQLVGDGSAFPAHLSAGFVFADEEVPEVKPGPDPLDAKSTNQQDPPAAKPMQQQRR